MKTRASFLNDRSNEIIFFALIMVFLWSTYAISQKRDQVVAIVNKTANTVVFYSQGKDITANVTASVDHSSISYSSALIPGGSLRWNADKSAFEAPSKDIRLVTTPERLVRSPEVEVIVTKASSRAGSIIGTALFILLLAYSTRLASDTPPLFPATRRRSLYLGGSLVIFIFVWALLHAAGTDIPGIANLTTTGKDGVDVYDLMRTNIKHFNQSFPPFDYTPLTLALMISGQNIFSVVLDPFCKAFNCDTSVISIAFTASIFHIFTAVFLFKALRVEDDQGRPSNFLALLFFPASFYLSIIFQQIDIVGVFFISIGSYLIVTHRSHTLAGALTAIGLGIKTQFFALLPVFLFYSFVFYWRRSQPSDRRWLGFLLGLMCTYLIIHLVNTFTTFNEFFSIQPQLARIHLSLWDIAPGLRVYSVPLFFGLALGVALMHAPQPTSTNDQIRFTLSSCALVACAYQSSFMHSPGMNSFILLGFYAFLATYSDPVKRFVFFSTSILSVSSWAFTSGDVSKLFFQTGSEFSIRYKDFLHSSEGLSLFYTFELTGLILMAYYCFLSLKPRCNTP